MAILANDKGAPRTPIPAGNYFGVCIGVYDIGTHVGIYGPKRRVVIQFELHKKKGVCRTEDGKPITLSKFYTLSFNEKATLRGDVESMLGRKFTDAEAKTGYDITQLLGTATRLVVTHNRQPDGSVRDAIDVFMPLDDDDDRPKPVSSAIVYEISPPTLVPDSVPSWLAKKINESEEMKGSSKQPAGTASDDESDIIF
jgi:hypothetical protein